MIFGFIHHRHRYNVVYVMYTIILDSPLRCLCAASAFFCARSIQICWILKTLTGRKFTYKLITYLIEFNICIIISFWNGRWFLISFQSAQNTWKIKNKIEIGWWTKKPTNERTRSRCIRINCALILFGCALERFARKSNRRLIERFTSVYIHFKI